MGTQRQSLEPRRMIVAIVLLHTAITAFSSSAAVLDGKGLEASECSEEDCATLYLVTSNGEEIPIKNTISKMKEKDVAGAMVASPSSRERASRGRASRWRPPPS